jgi:hypothetical protein
MEVTQYEDWCFYLQIPSEDTCIIQFYRKFSVLQRSVEQISFLQLKGSKFISVKKIAYKGGKRTDCINIL